RQYFAKASPNRLDSLVSSTETCLPVGLVRRPLSGTISADPRPGTAGRPAMDLLVVCLLDFSASSRPFTTPVRRTTRATQCIDRISKWVLRFLWQAPSRARSSSARLVQFRLGLRGRGEGRKQDSVDSGSGVQRCVA